MFQTRLALGTYQSALLGLWQEQEDHDESTEVETSVKRECAYRKVSMSRSSRSLAANTASLHVRHEW